MNWRGVNVTKLLVRDDFCLVVGEAVSPYDWYSPLQIAFMIFRGWFNKQTVIATDRYALDVEHERTRTTPND